MLSGLCSLYGLDSGALDGLDGINYVGFNSSDLILNIRVRVDDKTKKNSLADVHF